MGKNNQEETLTVTPSNKNKKEVKGGIRARQPPTWGAKRCSPIFEEAGGREKRKTTSGKTGGLFSLPRRVKGGEREITKQRVE